MVIDAPPTKINVGGQYNITRAPGFSASRAREILFLPAGQTAQKRLACDKTPQDLAEAVA
jgi:hypothetical protein